MGKTVQYYLRNINQINDSLSYDLKLEILKAEPEHLHRFKNQTDEMVLLSLELDPTTIEYVDTEHLSPKTLYVLLTHNPHIITRLYEPSKDMKRIAIEGDFNVIQYFPDLDDDLVRYVLNKNGLALQFIPKKKQNEELVLLATKENVEAYKYSYESFESVEKYILLNHPEHIKYVRNFYEEFLDLFLKYNPDLILNFYEMGFDITEEHIKIILDIDTKYFGMIRNPTESVIKYALERDYKILEQIPFNMEYVKYALEFDGMALKFIPKKDLKTIKKALDTNVRALELLDESREFLIDYAFKKDGYALKYIEKPTYVQCLDAVTRNPLAIEFVPPEFQTEAVQIKALSQLGKEAIPYLTTAASDDVQMEILRFLPTEIFNIPNPTEEMFITAFTTSAQLIQYFDNWQNTFSQQIINTALRTDGTLLEFVQENQTGLNVTNAIESFPAAIKWAVLQTPYIVEHAIRKDYRTIKFVNSDLITAELLELVKELEQLENN